MSSEPGPFEVMRRSRCSESIPAASVSEDVMCQAVASGLPSCSTTYSPPAAPSRHTNSTHHRKDRKVVPLFNNRAAGNSDYPAGELPEVADSDPLEIPAREYDCEHYDTCLSLAAALDWNSFSCTGCSGCVNQQLLWRANHALRKNNALRRICNLPLG